jgi:hypothetical protein
VRLSRATLAVPPVLGQIEQFLQSKRQGMWSAKPIAPLSRPTKEQSMEYLILAAVVSMMALYALIIIGCLNQPEW